MKKLALMAALALVMGLTFYATAGKTQTGPGYGRGYSMGPGMMGGGYGGYGMGPGMMGSGYGSGYGMGPGMMGPGYDYQYGPQYQQPQKSFDEKDAGTNLENCLNSSRNPNLNPGEDGGQR